MVYALVYNAHLEETLWVSVPEHDADLVWIEAKVEKTGGDGWRGWWAPLHRYELGEIADHFGIEDEWREWVSKREQK